MSRCNLFCLPKNMLHVAFVTVGNSQKKYIHVLQVAKYHIKSIKFN